MSKFTDLPDLPGEGPIDIDWVLELDREDPRVLLVWDGQVIASEPSHWESISQFVEVHALLRERYGERFRFLLPDPGAQMYLWGDNLTAAQWVDALNTRDIEGDDLDFVWYYVDQADGRVQRRVKSGDQDVWREYIWLKVAADLPIFDQTETRLRARFGTRFSEMVVAPSAEERVWGARWPPFQGENQLVFDYREHRDAVQISRNGQVLLNDDSEPGWRIGAGLAERLLRRRYGDRFAGLNT